LQLLGIAVLVASSIFLHESTHQKCIEVDPYGFQGGFQYQSETGGFHGGHVPRGDGHNGPHFEPYKAGPEVEPSSRAGSYAQAHAGSSVDFNPHYDQPHGRPGGQPSQGYGYGGDSDHKHPKKGGYCAGIIQKYKTCAIIGLVASIVQILISAVYCFANKKVIRWDTS